jgi:cysteine desulfurase
MAIKDLAVSSGSACTSASLEPSYVLRALGRNDELAHSSIRFTIGRFTTEEEIDYAIKLLHDKIGKLRELSPLVGNGAGRRRSEHGPVGCALS